MLDPRESSDEGDRAARGQGLAQSDALAGEASVMETGTGKIKSLRNARPFLRVGTGPTAVGTSPGVGRKHCNRQRSATHVLDGARNITPKVS